MKTLVDHINEALKIGKNLSDWSAYSCQPKTKEELKKIIKDRISEQGNKCDLNDIDVSLIDDMSYLFCSSKFNGNISVWNVSNVTNMECMFNNSSFNGGISRWNIRNVENMWFMFAYSKFNQDISKWVVSNVINMEGMFTRSKFNKDISNWKINKNCNTSNMFFDCPIKEEYKPKLPE